MYWTRRKKTSAPSKQYYLTPYVIIIMWLAVSIDVIAIAAGIAIILATADDGADGAAKHRTRNCARPGAETRKYGARESAGAGADCGARGSAGDNMVVGRGGRTAGQRETAHGGSRNYQTFHGRPPKLAQARSATQRVCRCFVPGIARWL